MPQTLVRLIYNTSNYQLHQTIIPDDDSELALHLPNANEAVMDIPLSVYRGFAVNNTHPLDALQKYIKTAAKKP